MAITNVIVGTQLTNVLLRRKASNGFTGDLMTLQNPQGTDEEKWAFFQHVRDEIGDRIKRFSETGE